MSILDDYADFDPLVEKGLAVLEGGLVIDLIFALEEGCHGLGVDGRGLTEFFEEKSGRFIEADEFGEIDVLRAFAAEDVLAADFPEYESFFDFHVNCVI